MKCPLLEHAYYSRIPGEPALDTECLEADCAWWAEGTSSCAGLSLVVIMASIGNVLGRLRDDQAQGSLTYRCFHCGLTATLPRTGVGSPPYAWSTLELNDRKSVWLCDRCGDRDEGGD